MKTLLSIILLLGTLGGFAQTTALKGFAYGQAEAPIGKEWEAPEELALNKEQPRAWFFTFTDVESARRVLPEHSSYYQSLNGDWKFHWVGNPEELSHYSNATSFGLFLRGLKEPRATSA